MDIIRKIFNYNTSLKFLMFFFQINGVLTVKFDGDLQNWRFICSKKKTIIVISVLNLFHFAWFVKSLLYFYSEFYAYKDLRLFDKVFNIAIDIFYIILTLFLRIMLPFHRQEVADICNKIKRIRGFSILHNDLSGRVFKKSMFRSLSIFSIAFLLWISGDAIYCYQHKEVFFLYTFSFILCRIAIHSVVLQYIFLILYMKEEFKFINLFLMKMKNYELSTSNVNFWFAIDVNKLQTVCDLHSKLYELSRLVSQFFSLPIFLCIFQMLTSLINFSYIIVSPLVFSTRVFDFKVYLNSHFREAQTVFLLVTLNMYATSVIAEVSL